MMEALIIGWAACSVDKERKIKKYINQTQNEAHNVL